MGFVWERQIRSARNILSSLMKTHGASLDEESLNTLFVEVEGIVNSRPLVVETINDVNSQAPLITKPHPKHEVESCDAPSWHVWDTQPSSQKEMEEGTAYQ